MSGKRKIEYFNLSDHLPDRLEVYLKEKIIDARSKLDSEGSNARIKICSEAEVASFLGLSGDRLPQVIDLRRILNFLRKEFCGSEYRIQKNSEPIFFIQKRLREVQPARKPIPDSGTDLDEIKSLLDGLQDVAPSVRDSALSVIRHVIQRTLDPENYHEGDTWVQRVEKRTADVELPEQAPELWVDSSEKEKAESGEIRLDDALVAFTRRVYAPWLRSDGTGLAVSEVGACDDELYKQLKMCRNRMNGRNETFPFLPVKVRNKILVDKILSGELAPPKDLTLFRTLGAVAARQGTPLTAANLSK